LHALLTTCNLRHYVEGLVGEILNGEIDADAAAEGASHSAVDVLLGDDFEPLVIEDKRPTAECEAGPTLS